MRRRSRSLSPAGGSLVRTLIKILAALFRAIGFIVLVLAGSYSLVITYLYGMHTAVWHGIGICMAAIGAILLGSWLRKVVQGKKGKLVGQFSWTPPAWLADFNKKASGVGDVAKAYFSKLRSKIKQDPRYFWTATAAALVVLFVSAVGVRWYKSQPQIIRFDVTGTNPKLTKIEDELKPDSVHIYFGGSSARLDQIGKSIDQGIKISPPLPGAWRWTSDKQITFSPTEDWGVGQKYQVELDRSIFPDHVHLEKYHYAFKSAPFTVAISEAKFYQNPRKQRVKKVVATVSFSHPVDVLDFERRISLQMAGRETGFFGLGGEEGFPYTVSYNKYKSEAYIHSGIVEIPKDDTYMTLTVKEGVRAERGGPPAEQKLEKKIPIPGMYNFFRVNSAELTLVRNERYEPERILVLQMTAGALESEIQNNLEVYELPKDRPPMHGRPAAVNYHWHDKRKIGPEILSLSTRIVLEPLPTAREYATLHSFKYKSKPGRYLYLKLKQGIKCYGGYILAKEFDHIARVPEFPKELKIMADGAILSMSGEKKLSIISRDIEAIRFEVGRVIAGQINHLVSQSGGQLRNPSFQNWKFNQDNISEMFSEVRILGRVQPGKTQYSAFDLSKYLASGGMKRGLFFFKIESWDPVNRRSTGAKDTRLILITDLGILVKNTQDGGHDVFVQSIRDGRPVSKAVVEVIGKNGLPVLSKFSDATGHARFPSLTGFQREKTPTAYVVRQGTDVSFLPYNWGDRTLNFSRFDVGGVRTQGSGERLQAYLFSDRGIYRPGDEFHIGMIVKSSNWGKDLSGVPLEAAVTDSRGLEVLKHRFSLSSLGFHEISYKTQENSPTGNYHVRIYIVKDNRRRNLLGYTSVRVEEFLPDRMRITTRLSKERRQGWVSPEGLKGLVALKNLFGTPAANRRVAASITLAPSYPSFRSYSDHKFFDPLRAKNTFTERLEDGRTDDNGEVEFDLDLDRFEKATYRLTFLAEGYEAEGGRSVNSESSVLVSELEYLVGYKPDGDLRYIHKNSKRSVEIIAVDSALRKVEVTELKAHLFELRYISTLVQQPNRTYKYQSVLKEIPIGEKDLSIPATGLQYTLPTAQPGDYALIVRDADDIELSRVEFSIVGRANLTRSLEKNAELQVRLNKEDYAPGEEIEIQIKAPYVGAGLITIERDRVYAYKWFKTQTTATTQKIRVPGDMEGNGYVNVAFVRGADSQEIFMSPLSYGVMPFTVSRKRRINPITLDSPDLALPGEDYRIRYKSEKPGKIVVFAVDEGILQVAGYKTPDPLSHFFQKRALEVRTLQILDLILPEFEMVRAWSSPGGGEGREALGKNLNPFKRKREKPVAYWSGIIDVDKTTREVVYKVPDYFNGTLRVMAVAVSADAIGVAEKKAIIRGHFVITPNLPMVVAPGDQFEVSLGVANNVEGSGKNADVILVVRPSKHLEVLGDQKQILKISEGRETSTSFKLAALNQLGSGSLTFTAVSGPKKAKVTSTLSVRPPMPYRTTLASGYFRSSKAKVPVTRRMYPHYRTLEASASTLPLGLARGLVSYLKGFPYGCTEQLISQAFPAIVLRHRPEFGYSPKKVRDSMANTIRVLRSRQNAAGAFGFWAANSHVSDWQTVYAMHFLTEAKEKGYPVPQDMLNRGFSYLGGLAGAEPSSLSAARASAYAAYILTRNGMVMTTPIMSLRRHLDRKFPKQWETDLTGIYLAASHRLLQQRRQAGSLIRKSKLGDQQETDYEAFYDGLVRDSQLLYILARHFPERLKRIQGDEILHIVDPVIKRKYNSISSAYTILALDAYAEAVGSPQPGKMDFAEIQSGNKTRPLPLPGGLFPVVRFSDKAEAIDIKDTSGHTIFYQVTTAGFDLAPPKDVVKDGLEVQREYRDENGKTVTEIGMGSNLDVHVKVRSLGNKRLQNIAVMDLLPGGFEVIIDPSTRDQSQKGNWRSDYTDIREDRVVIFGSVGPDVQEFIYRIRATNKGRYAIPPVFAESMYDKTLQARELGGEMVVE